MIRKTVLRDEPNYWWRIRRRYVKWCVKRLIESYCSFIIDNETNRSNMVIAEAKFRKAEIEYWEASFKAWGDWNMFGPNNFVFEPGETKMMEYEMEEIGFSKYKGYFGKPMEG